MRVEWTPAAAGDLESLAAFVAHDNPRAAAVQVLRILDAVVGILAENPAIGRPGRIAGTREWSVARAPFLVVYRVSAGVLQVLRVLHGARRWPESF